MEPSEIRVPIQRDTDIVAARFKGRQLAEEVGFARRDIVLIATAISEIARNIVVYAAPGEIVLSTETAGSRQGILVVARDHGPGIPDIEAAMRDGFSTGKSLGLGLPGAKRLMDKFEIVSIVGRGTTVMMAKWVP